MLLRSVTEHVRNQNWFAVWIDFAIVVFGVIIGLQVANWNEVQTQRAQTQRMLGEVLVDLEEIRKLSARMRDAEFDTTILTDALITSLEVGKETTPGDVLATFNQMSYFSQAAPPPAALSDLLVSARLDLIERDSMRDALRQLAETFAMSRETQVEYMRVFNSAWAELSQHVTLRRTPNVERDRARWSFKEVDIAALRSDKQARVSLTRLYIFQENMQSLHQRSLDAIDAVLAETSDSSEEE